MRIHTTALLVAACLGLAACGGDDEQDAAGNGRADDGQDAMQQFAECMREQGIDFPDPKPGGGPQIIDAIEESSPDELREAEEACAEYREAIAPPDLSEEEEQEFKDAALAHSRCMREQGIDMPDPQFGADGRAEINIGKGGIDPTDPEFREAQEACADTMPQLRREP